MAAALSHHKDLSYSKLIKGRSVLHYAPEAIIKNTLREYAERYVTADLLRDDVDLKLDISDMASVEACKFDVIVACDVLEHVDDDIKAMLELFRVLSVGGYAILTVPQKDNLEVTIEDRAVVDPAERKRVFGQWDHVRIYGDSFPRILESVGFNVTVINEAQFPEAMVKRHVLFPPVLSSRPLATNHRKVFFAQKTDL
ncbi:MAG: methyltransferase domain-containing protein [Gemmatimonadota bacterium]